MTQMQPGAAEPGAYQVWSSAIEDELAFWDRWFASKGLEWPEDYRARLSPDTPLSPYHCEMVDAVPRESVYVLDVGSGPISKLGKVHPQKRVSIFATDALADQYAKIIAKYGVEPPIRTIRAEAERLTEHFPHDSFDLVTAQNCIDHTFDPVEAVRQMILVARPGCRVALDHAENEADNEGWAGLHQWNFTIEQGHFIIRGRTTRVDVTETLAALADCWCEPTAKNCWVRVHFIKKAATKP